MRGWKHYPSEKARLLDILSRTRNPILLSGDRHFAELSRLVPPEHYVPLYDLTSSGFTHSYQPEQEPNRHRVGQGYFELNFGAIDVDWANAQLALRVHGPDGVVGLDHRVPLSLPER